MSAQTKKFKTEVQQLLDLMIHSLYSNKDIFLRELVANAADAIDKARFESLTNPDISADWQIRIEPDKSRNILQISDNGIGMTREEVIENIGTIAKSGTKAFLHALENKEVNESPDLIGQFGVGFYSAFMVADKVELITKRAGSDEPATIWESAGKEKFKIDDHPRTEQGTTIIIHLKESQKAYLEEWQIRSIIKKYSDFIEHPIVMPVTKKEKDESEKTEDEVLNSQKAIWLRPASEISEEEYKQFYSHLAHFDSEPLTHIHYAAEGTSEFKALLYLPSKAPFDLFNPEQRKKTLHLYIRRIFISDECSGLLPEYLRFVKGVVDSSDLPLNISREMLQDNPGIGKIRKNLVRKVLGELKKMMENDNEKYLNFYREFGKVLKEGIHLDFENKEKIQDLVLFESMKNESGKLISLKEYVSVMPSEQKEIYYITGETRTLLENSPHLEMFKNKGVDVLFMTDPIDEWIVGAIGEYSGKKLTAVGKGDIELDEDAKKQSEKAAKQHKNLLEFIQKKLDSRIKEVRFSSRLTDSACCLVSDEYEPSAYMERLFQAMNQQAPPSKRILELNSQHPLIESLQSLYDKDKESPKLAEFAELLYDQALLTEGNPIPDPLEFTKRLANLMVLGLKKETEN